MSKTFLLTPRTTEKVSFYPNNYCSTWQNLGIFQCLSTSFSKSRKTKTTALVPVIVLPSDAVLAMLSKPDEKSHSHLPPPATFCLYVSRHCPLENHWPKNKCLIGKFQVSAKSHPWRSHANNWQLILLIVIRTGQSSQALAFHRDVQITQVSHFLAGAHSLAIFLQNDSFTKGMRSYLSENNE